MPKYGRKRSFKRKSYARKKTYKRKSVFKKRVRSIARSAVRSFAETKYYEASTIVTQPDFNGTFFNLFQPSQGNSSVTRVGDVCQVNYIRVHFFCNLPSGTTDPMNIRVMCFKWLVDTFVDTPQSTELYNSVGGQFAPFSFRQWYKDNNRYKILAVKDIRLDPVGQWSFYGKMNIPMKGMKWKATESASTSSFMNGLYLSIISDRGGAQTLPLIKIISRVTFKDV